MRISFIAGTPFFKKSFLKLWFKKKQKSLKTTYHFLSMFSSFFF